MVIGVVIGPESDAMSIIDRANDRPVAQRSAGGVAPLVRSGEVSAEVLAARLGRWTQGEGTLVARLSDGVAALISGGELRAGDRLPAERGFAAASAVSRLSLIHI